MKYLIGLLLILVGFCCLPSVSATPAVVYQGQCYNYQPGDIACQELCYNLGGVIEKEVLTSTPYSVVCGNSIDGPCRYTGSLLYYEGVCGVLCSILMGPLNVIVCQVIVI